MENEAYTLPGLHIVDRRVEVPLDWTSSDDGQTITVFLREVCDPAKKEDHLPLLVFLQGGPGVSRPDRRRIAPVGYTKR